MRQRLHRHVQARFVRPPVLPVEGAAPVEAVRRPRPHPSPPSPHQSLLKVPVVLATFRRAGQDGVGVGDDLELLSVAVRLLVEVRVSLHRQPPKGLFDFLLRRRPGDAESLVVVRPGQHGKAVVTAAICVTARTSFVALLLGYSSRISAYHEVLVLEGG